MSAAITPIEFASAPQWQCGERKMRCIQITQETHDVNSFCFAGDEPIKFAFKPGQYIKISALIEGQMVSRFYSISSSPARPYNFSITVKRVPGGLMSNWLHDALQEGDYLTIEGPQGDFNFTDIPSHKVLMLSGGSGITPVMSMARWLYDIAAHVDIHFVHSARTPADIIFLKELESMDARWPNFRLSVICEGSLAGNSWPGYRGFLNAETLSQMVTDIDERTLYCCGPEAYMQAVRSIKASLNIADHLYHEESFGGQESAPVIADGQTGDLPIDKAFVTFVKTGNTIEANASETVLDIAAKNGVWINSACRMGFCGSCKVRATRGQLICNHTGGITDEELAEGYALACCSYASGSVTLET